MAEKTKAIILISQYYGYLLKHFFNKSPVKDLVVLVILLKE